MTTSKGGCGCGGKSSGGGCGCGGKSAATSTGTGMVAASCSTCDDGAYLRPQFFAGQLLTEDDLDAIETYVVGKNRLHNARLFGAGVVCGLEVTCGACDTMTIDVAPGYALDCCGNDLVLSCDRELDLRPMIAGLRSGSSDCGDPCAPANVATKGTATKSPVFDYCLYARYTETPTDPTTAYPTGGDCTTVTCQPTRIREGITFELRCAPSTATPDDVLTRALACLSRLSAPDRQVGNANAIERGARELEVAQKRLARVSAPAPAPAATTTAPTTTPAPTVAPAALSTSSTAAPAVTNITYLPLSDVEQTLWTQASTELSTIATRANQASPPTPTAAELVQWAELVVASFGLSIRLQAATASTTVATKAAAPATASTASTAYNYIVPLLVKATGIPNQLDQLYAQQVGTIFTPLLQRAGVSDDVNAHSVDDAATTYALAGAIHDATMYQAYVARAIELRTQLANAVSCTGGTTTDCALFDDIRALTLPALPTDGDADPGAVEANDVIAFGRELGGLVKRFFADCICRAMNPPCPSCDDPGVLLACIKVRDCHVIDICNMTRTFVWSPAAARYWLPPLTWLGDLLAKLCCAGGCSDDVARAQFSTDAKAQFVTALVKQPSPALLDLVMPAFYGSSTQVSQLASAGQSLVELATRRLVPSTAFQASSADDLIAQLERRIEKLELAAQKTTRHR
ncbi:MAG TPA: hypothetical protein VGG28_27365 [Kofleriaceae bacterium]|jgi:hypothetical protein